MTTIQIYGEIGAGDATAQAVSAALASAGGGPVDVYLSSKGGSCWDGLAIFNMLRAHPGEVTVHVVGVAASMASAIAMAGDRVLVAPGALMMLHNAYVAAEGDGAALRKSAALVDKLRDTLANVYAGRTGKPAADILPVMAGEEWFDADEAIAFGLADALDDTTPTTPPPAALPAATARGIPMAAAPQIRQELATMAATATPRGAAAPKAADAPPMDPTKKPDETKPPEPKAAVDVTSEDYKAGYAAGLAAAQAGETAEDVVPGGGTMPAAATVAEVKALFGDDAATALACIERGMTLPQAKTVADVLAKAAKPPAAKAGNKPLGGATADPSAAAADPAAYADARAEFNGAVRALVKGGEYDFQAAAAHVVRTNPDLHQRMLAEANAKAAEAQARLRR